jgi:diguanylate cyclase (GGDEF)-like protein
MVGTNRLADPAVAGIVVNAHDVTERKELETRLAHQASHDPLTGLANRTPLLDSLRLVGSQVHQGGESAALLYIDLDYFKILNDQRGHHTGDDVLVELGARLRAELRPGDLVARLGGDEFVVICQHVACLDDARDVAQRILELIDRPVRVDSKNLHVTASIGVTPIDASPAEAILRRADTAMYLAKTNGRNRIECATS